MLFVAASLLNSVSSDLLSSCLLACFQPEGLDAEADAEVDRIVSELTSGLLSPAGAAPTKSAAAAAAVGSAAAKSETVDEEVRYCVN